MNRNTLVMLGTVSAVFILFQVPPVFAGEISLDSFAENGKEKMEISLDFLSGEAEDADISGSCEQEDLSGFGSLMPDEISFSGTTFDGKTVSMNASIDLEALEKLEKEGADNYLSSVFGSSYSGDDSKKTGSALPDTDFEDLSLKYKDLKASMDRASEGIGEDLAIPDSPESENSNVKDVFKSSWGDLSDTLKAEDYQIPSDFNPDKTLEEGIKNRDEVFQSLQRSDAYKEAKNRLDAESIYNKAASGPEGYSLDSNSELASRIKGALPQVDKNISSISGPLKEKYESGKGIAKAKNDAAVKNNRETYDKRKDYFQDEYNSAKEKNSLSGQAESLFSN